MAVSSGHLEEKKAPMPMYRDPALDVRAMVLPAKEPAENYQISEGGDSEQEDAAERERLRQKKVVPKWCAPGLWKEVKGAWKELLGSGEGKRVAV